MIQPIDSNFISEFEKLKEYSDRELAAAKRINATYAKPYVRASKWSDSSYVDANISSVINESNVETGVMKTAKLAKTGGVVMNFYNSFVNVSTR